MSDSLVNVLKACAQSTCIRNPSTGKSRLSGSFPGSPADRSDGQLLNPKRRPVSARSAEIPCRLHQEIIAVLMVGLNTQPNIPTIFARLANTDITTLGRVSWACPKGRASISLGLPHLGGQESMCKQTQITLSHACAGTKASAGPAY